MNIGTLPASHLPSVLYSHGWLYLSPAEEADGGFRYALTLPCAGACSITVKPVRGTLICQADRTLSARDRAALRQVIHRMLSLDFPLEEFQAVCKARKATRFLRLSRQGWGRMFRSPTCWEDAVKTLCTTNASWGYTQQMCQRLCAELGEATPSGSKAFPTPQRVIDAGEPFLKKTVGMGYRSKSLFLLAGKASSNKVPWLLDDSILVGEGEAEKEIESWHGFGRYATRHLLVLMGFHRYLPVDREVGLHLGVRKAGDRDSKLDADHFAAWGKFRFTAYKVSRVAKRLNWIGD
jgi:3-methyladenine DNA glycosylase/8-oxoguanine DNA glycosylase